jgi:predicted Zn-dependent protease
MHFFPPFPQRFLAKSLAAMLACILAVAPLRANELPELGDVASSELSLVTEKKIGQQIMHEIRWRDASYLDDPDVENYLNQIGGRLVAVSNDPGLGFFFFPINDNSINAFAMPGGFIGVHSGLMLAAQSESELAGVMAHEISHVTQRHIARQVFQTRHLSMASMIAMGLALLAARSNSQVAGAAIATTEAGAISAQLAFSRDFEREADRLGFETLRKAGFDVRGMANFFERLQRSSRLYENNATAYLRSHPLSGERMGDMQNRDQSVPYRQVPDSQEFHLVRAKLRAQQGSTLDAIKDFEDLLRERKFVSEGAAHFGLAMAQLRARNWAVAEKELLAARQLKISSAMLDHQLAEVKIARGDLDAGIALYREAMLRYPLNLALVYGYEQALLQARRFAEALKFAEAQLLNYPQDVRLHKMRAESFAGLGKIAQQHLALSEVFLLQGQTMGAIEQLNIAQRAGDADFYTLSAIDSRQRELKRRHLEEEKERRK